MEMYKLWQEKGMSDWINAIIDFTESRIKCSIKVNTLEPNPSDFFQIKSLLKALGNLA